MGGVPHIHIYIYINQSWGDLMQQDLRQGGVGDCWFMSARCSALTLVHGSSSGFRLEALAVVAERPDLVLRLFGDTARTRPWPKRLASKQARQGDGSRFRCRESVSQWSTRGHTLCSARSFLHGRNQAGCYQVNLFLDGEWRVVCQA